MSNATLTRLSEERASQEQFIAELLAAAETETRDLVETELRSIQSAEARIAEIDAQMAPLAAFEQRRAAAIDVSKLAQGSAPRAQQVHEVEARSLGEIFTASEQFRSYSGRGTSEVLHLPEFRAVGDPIMTTTDPGKKWLPNPQRFAGPEHFRRFPLLDLIGRIEVSTNVVEYFTTTEPAGADKVDEGELKPFVSWDSDLVNYTLATYAGVVAYSRQAAEDIPQLRSLIDAKIRRSLDIKLNTEATAVMLSAKVAANTTTGAAGKPLLEAIRVAMGELDARGLPATAIALNPADHASLDITLLGATMNGASRYGSYFGVPVISLVDVPKGTAVVGDLEQAIVAFFKGGMSLYTTDSDILGEGANAKSAFKRNVLHTLGEVRLAFGAVDKSAIQFAVATP